MGTEGPSEVLWGNAVADPKRRKRAKKLTKGDKAVSPLVKAGEWFLHSRWKTHKSRVTLNVSGSIEKPVLQDESSSCVLSLGVSSFLFFVFSPVIPFIFLSLLFFQG